MLAYHNK